MLELAPHLRVPDSPPRFSRSTLVGVSPEKKFASPCLVQESGALVAVDRENVPANTGGHQCPSPSSVLGRQQVLRCHCPHRLLLPATRDSKIQVCDELRAGLACEAHSCG